MTNESTHKAILKLADATEAITATVVRITELHSWAEAGGDRRGRAPALIAGHLVMLLDAEQSLKAAVTDLHQACLTQ